MELKEARAQIDAIDKQLMELFVQRLGLMDAILDYKIAHKLAVFDAAREAERLRAAAAAGGQYAEETRRLMEQTMAICRNYQQRRLQESRMR